MRYLITVIPEDDADVVNPLAGAWELLPVPAQPSEADLLTAGYSELDGW